MGYSILMHKNTKRGGKFKQNINQGGLWTPQEYVREYGYNRYSKRYKKSNNS